LRLLLSSLQVLTFKEITWQTLRVEADAIENGDQDPVTTPLRLITNQGRIQIALKRRVSEFPVPGNLWKLVLCHCPHGLSIVGEASVVLFRYFQKPVSTRITYTPA
jgi:hypothetical protein